MHQTNVPRHIKIGLMVLGIGLVITLGFFVDVLGRVRSVVNDRETAANPFTPPAAPLYAPTDPPMTVKLFFPGPMSDILLSSEDAAIYKSAEVSNRARQILQKLLEGPQSTGMSGSIPAETRVQEIFVSEQKIAFINFSDSIAGNHPGGILNEQATIYSIVNSLTYNLPEIQQVKILIGGIEKETLAGHCLLLLPLEMDLAVTDVPPPAPRSDAQAANIQ